MVLCIDKDNVDMVSYSNSIGKGVQATYNGDIESHRKLFEKWFKTSLN